MQEVGENTWHVEIFSKLSGYIVTLINPDCNCTDQMKCIKPQCASLCYHMYTCDTFCYDYTNGHICKHIHHIKSLSYDKENIVKRISKNCLQMNILTMIC